MFIPLLLAFIGMAAHNEATVKSEYYWDMDALHSAWRTKGAHQEDAGAPRRPTMSTFSFIFRQKRPGPGSPARTTGNAAPVPQRPLHPQAGAGAFVVLVSLTRYEPP